MHRQLKYLFAILLIIGCGTGSPVTFKSPQPEGKKNILKFPRQIQANYQSEDKTSFLTITDNAILQTYSYEIKIPKDSLDAFSVTLKGDTIFDLKTGDKYKVEINKDTINVEYNNVNTIFKISDKEVLKYFKGYYFLNTFDDGSWTVQKLYLLKGILTIGNISDSSAINQLKELTHSDSDTISFSLTKKQFKTFIKKGGFTDNQKFIRLHKNY